jgi:hypothetical protein
MLTGRKTCTKVRPCCGVLSYQLFCFFIDVFELWEETRAKVREIFFEVFAVVSMSNPRQSAATSNEKISSLPDRENVCIESNFNNSCPFLVIYLLQIFWYTKTSLLR